jgi:hypothetical protein
VRTLEAVWADHDRCYDARVNLYDLLDEYRRWTEEQRRVNVGLVEENKALKKQRETYQANLAAAFRERDETHRELEQLRRRVA